MWYKCKSKTVSKPQHGENIAVWHFYFLTYSVKLIKSIVTKTSKHFQLYYLFFNTKWISKTMIFRVLWLCRKLHDLRQHFVKLEVIPPWPYVKPELGWYYDVLLLYSTHACTTASGAVTSEWLTSDTIINFLCKNRSLKLT